MKEEKLKNEFYGTESEFIELVLNKDYDELKALGYDEEFIDFAYRAKLEGLTHFHKTIKKYCKAGTVTKIMNLLN
jgi:hypothetical protein